MIKLTGKKIFVRTISLTLLMVVSQLAGAEVRTLGDVARTITESFEDITRLITAGSYLAGLGFSIGAIMKFRQHKDNPSQIPVGTPIAMLFVASCMLFLPSILGVTGASLFGPGGGQTAGPKGTIFTPR